MPKAPPPASPAAPLLFDINSACAALSCHRSTIYRLLAEGRLRGKKLRGRLMIPAGEIQRFVAELPDATFTPPPKSGK